MLQDMLQYYLKVTRTDKFKSKMEPNMHLEREREIAVIIIICRTGWLT
jgi:hypothetical protein